MKNKFALLFLLLLPISLSVSAPSGNWTAPAPVVLSTTAVLVSARSTNQISVAIRNLDASINIYVGPDATVTSSKGFLVKPNETITINTQSAVYAVAASGTPSVNILTEKD